MKFRDLFANKEIIIVSHDKKIKIREVSFQIP